MFVMARDRHRPQAHIFFSMMIVANPSILTTTKHIVVTLARKVRRRFRMLGDVSCSLRTFRHSFLVSLPPNLSVFSRLFRFLHGIQNSLIITRLGG